MKRTLFIFLLASIIFCACGQGKGNKPNGAGGQAFGGFGGFGGSAAAISDSTTVKQIVTSFDAPTPATAAVPGGNAYVANKSPRDITTLDDDYKSAMAKISAKITINLQDESSWDSSVVREGELVTVTTADSAAVEITGSTAKKTAFLFKNKKGCAVKLSLTNASFSSENFPCIEFDKAAKVYLEANGANTLTDGRAFGTGYGNGYTDAAHAAQYPGREVTQKWVENGSKKKGSIYIKGAAVLAGGGSLTLNEGYKHGIYATDYIRVFSGKWTVNSTGRNAFQSVNGFVMDGGEIAINGSGDHTNNQSRGIIVEGMDFEDGKANEFPGEGFIVIKGGKIAINTVGKAISAKWDIDDDAGSASTDDDPYPYVLITGGTIDITTSGIPQDESRNASTFADADGVTVSERTKLSPEGIEGKQAVIISGGAVTLNVTDDGINASRSDRTRGGWVTVSGGNIFVNSAYGDAIDSNGTIDISGGVIVGYGTKMAECAFDCDQNQFAITGGLLLGIGTGNFSMPTQGATTQGTLVLSGGEYGSGTFAVLDSAKKPVFAYTVPESIAENPQYVMVLSSPALKGGTYTVKKAAKAKGGETFHNLYTALPSVSGGTNGSSATIEGGGCVQTIDAVNAWGFGGRGGFPNGMPPDFGGEPPDFDPNNLPPGFDPNAAPPNFDGEPPAFNGKPPRDFDPNNAPQFDGKGGRKKR